MGRFKSDAVPPLAGEAMSFPMTGFRVVAFSGPPAACIRLFRSQASFFQAFGG